MYLYLVCVLVFHLLELTGSTGVKWEVLNDVHRDLDDDRATQYEILSREELIPYVKAKPIRRPMVFKQEKVKKTIAAGKAAPQNNGKQAKPAQLRAKPSSQSSMEESELLPLGVPHGTRRHLLQLSGPTLTQEAETQRQVAKFKSDNLSSPCKDAVDEDCLFDIDGWASDHITETRTDSEDPGPLSRHKRQAQNNGNSDSDDDNDDDSSDDSDPGSGTSESSEELYSSREEEQKGGKYKIKFPLGFKLNGETLTQKQINERKKELKEKLEAALATFPGFEKVATEGGEIKNDNLVFNIELTIDGSKAAALAQLAGNDNLEDFMLGRLRNSTIPAINNLQIGGNRVADEYLWDQKFVDDLRFIMNDYCGAVDPCANAGPEYDRDSCTNTGFMTGTCSHKCQGYPCQNNALCELNAQYEPVCNCGENFKGKYCQKKRNKPKKMNTAKTVATAVSAGIAAVCTVSCCVALVLRRKSKPIAFTNYEDVGSEERTTDPTSFSIYIDRPQWERFRGSLFSSASSSS